VTWGAYVAEGGDAGGGGGQDVAGAERRRASHRHHRHRHSRNRNWKCDGCAGEGETTSGDGGRREVGPACSDSPVTF
jgi:hypothetical protein